MKISSLLKEEELNPSDYEIKFIKERTKYLTNLIKKEIDKKNINDSVFLGGSFAKDTLLKSENYDVDIFIRFDSKYKDKEMINEIEKILSASKVKSLKVHGSRDYFRIIESPNLTFEIIPVLKISKQSQARNVTDLSYFHVNYIKNKLNKNIKKEILMLKHICKSLGIYGAESYINGFSGYSIECLIIYYKTIENFLKSILKIKENEKIVIDANKLYKNKNSILMEINESKQNSPIILVDPTFKERNALAGLNKESFEKLRIFASKILKNPSKKLLIKRNAEEEIKSEKIDKNTEKICLEATTNKQEGDVAGTKLKKFFLLIKKEFEEYYKVKRYEFIYSGEESGKCYFILSKKKEIIKKGPPISRVEHSRKFKEKHKHFYEKKGILYAKINISKDAKSFMKDYISNNNSKIKDMYITNLSIT